MAVAGNTKTTTENIADLATENISAFTTEVPVLAKKFREQLVSNLHQGQQLSIDAAQTWVKAVSVLPHMELPMVHGIPMMGDLETATKYTFDVATDLLGAQRDFAMQLASAFVPVKTV
jgi:hypothetical protein